MMQAHPPDVARSWGAAVVQAAERLQGYVNQSSVRERRADLVRTAQHGPAADAGSRLGS
jgi:hypothetical protein